MNVVILRGNLGADAEEKQFDGRVVINFRMAVSERGFTAKDGTVIPEHTDWFNVVVNAGLGTKLGEWLKRGTNVLIRGKLRNRSYQDNAGVVRTVTEVIVEGKNVELVTSKGMT